MPKGALCLSARLRMLQKPASVVLASPKCFAQAGRLAQGLNVMKARANYLFARCGPCPVKGASWRAGVGRVRR